MRIKVLLFCVLLLMGTCACAPSQEDFFAPFQGEFSARLVGEWQAIAFEAELAASAPVEGTRVMTLTFYAPSSLCGTVLTRDNTGALTLAAGELSLPLTSAAAAGYGALFDLFPTTGTVQSITREGENTRLTGEGFSLLFSPDGTPLSAENGAARVQVSEFAR